MSQNIFELLKTIRVVDESSIVPFAQGTRDRPDLTVWRDRKSGVIYIKDHYVGDEEYETGNYRNREMYRFDKPDYERWNDCERRTKAYRQFYTGKDICDFGCGAGDFLKATRLNCKSVIGVELQKNYLVSMTNMGISCTRRMSDIDDDSLDVIFLFHTLEHLPNPAQVIRNLKKKLKPGGRFVFEVPHAGDLLLREDIGGEAFKRFTLWSQHLVLHTRFSIRALLEHCGLEEITVEGVQRYSLSNHLQWLARGKPGGHKSVLSLIDTPDLVEAYSAALSRIDATDTLVAVAETKQT